MLNFDWYVRYRSRGGTELLKAFGEGSKDLLFIKDSVVCFLRVSGELTLSR
jgi:hypothetical protein